MRQQNVSELPGSIDASNPAALAHLIIEHASDAIFLLDGEGRTTFANPAAEEMFGWSRSELLGKKLHDVIHYRHPDGRPFPMSDCPLGHVFETGESLRLHEDIFYRRSGEEVAVACSNAAIIDAGKVQAGVLIVRDITERLEAERHKQLLVDELHHRVKNMLSVVQAIASQSLRGPDYQQVRADLSARLLALAQAQDLILTSEGIGASLRTIIERAITPFSGAERIRIDGPDAVIPPRLATAVAMALHELGTNAAKYGSLSAEMGSVAVEWEVRTIDSEKHLMLVWTEAGGPAVVPPTRQGFGSRMVAKLLTAETKGKADIQFLPTGVVATLSAPIREP